MRGKEREETNALAARETDKRIAEKSNGRKMKKKRKSERTGKRRAKVTEASWPGRFGPVGTRWWPAALIAVRGRDVASSRRTHVRTHIHTRTKSNVRPHLRLRAVIGDGSGERRSRSGALRGLSIRERNGGTQPDRLTGGKGGPCIPERRRPVYGTPARSVESRRLRHNPISSSFSDSLRPKPARSSPSSVLVTFTTTCATTSVFLLLSLSLFLS